MKVNIVNIVLIDFKFFNFFVRFFDNFFLNILEFIKLFVIEVFLLRFLFWNSGFVLEN